MSEVRLIDANALWEFMRTYDDYQGTKEAHDLELIHRDSILFAIETAPTVNAVPVVHAYWIIKPHGTYGQLRAFCSACGKHSGIGGIVSNQKKPYCPNCGARMRGEKQC